MFRTYTLYAHLALSLFLVTSCSDPSQNNSTLPSQDALADFSGDASVDVLTDVTTDTSGDAAHDLKSPDLDSSLDDTSPDDAAPDMPLPMPCVQDQYVISNVCAACRKGTTNAAGDNALGEDTFCDPVLCGENELVNSNQCVACPVSSTNMAGDDASGEDTSCDAERCPSNTMVFLNQCEPCPDGSTNAAGDDASGGDTSCDPTLCAEGFIVSTNACVSCPVGISNAAGDDASGADTFCDPTPCAEGEYVLANTCVTCPPGTTNDSGDDAARSDTQCDMVFCAENEYVLANTCVGCPADTTNAAGDDASSVDTACQDACAVALGVPCDQFKEAYIKASNTDAQDFFSSSLDFDGDTLVVSARGEDSLSTGINGDQFNDPADFNYGAVYVFQRTGSTWSQQAYIKHPHPIANPAFGVSVAVSGDTIAIGATGDDAPFGGTGDQFNRLTEDSGAVYIYTRSGSTWSQQAYIKASNADKEDYFGSVIDLEGDTLVVGVSNEDSNATGINGNQADNSSPKSGAVYVFQRTGSVWSQEAYLKASNTDSRDEFGFSLALSGNMLAVGALYESSDASNINGDQTSNTLSGSGAVYVFERTGNTWTQQAYVKSFLPYQGDYFGSAVALDGSTLVVTARNEQRRSRGVDGFRAGLSLFRSGAVYVLERAGNTWTQQAYIKPPIATDYNYFGRALAISSNTLFIGSYGKGTFGPGLGFNGGPSPDSAYLDGSVDMYTRTGSTWSNQAHIKATYPGPNDFFGGKLALDGNTLVIGASNEDSSATGINGNQQNDSAESSGAVYVRRIAP